MPQPSQHPLVTLNGRLGRVRRETLNGRAYLVAPFVSIVPGVLNGSRGGLFYPASEVAANPGVWNSIPLTLGHPADPLTNLPESARQPHVLQRVQLGNVFRDHVTENGERAGEAWFDEVLTRERAPAVYNALDKAARGKAVAPVELSTGLYTDNLPAANGSTDPKTGRPYEAVAVNYRPDHLAILEHQKGACSVDDGCGVALNANPEGHNQYTGGGGKKDKPLTPNERCRMRKELLNAVDEHEDPDITDQIKRAVTEGTDADLKELYRQTFGEDWSGGGKPTRNAAAAPAVGPGSPGTTDDGSVQTVTGRPAPSTTPAAPVAAPVAPAKVKAPKPNNPAKGYAEASRPLGTGAISNSAADDLEECEADCDDGDCVDECLAELTGNAGNPDQARDEKGRFAAASQAVKEQGGETKRIGNATYVKLGDKLAQVKGPYRPGGVWKTDIYHTKPEFEQAWAEGKLTPVERGDVTHEQNRIIAAMTMGDSGAIHPDLHHGHAENLGYLYKSKAQALHAAHAHLLGMPKPKFTRNAAEDAPAENSMNVPKSFWTRALETLGVITRNAAPQGSPTPPDSPATRHLDTGQWLPRSSNKVSDKQLAAAVKQGWDHRSGQEVPPQDDPDDDGDGPEKGFGRFDDPSNEGVNKAEEAESIPVVRNSGDVQSAGIKVGGVPKPPGQFLIDALPPRRVENLESEAAAVAEDSGGSGMAGDPIHVGPTAPTGNAAPALRCPKCGARLTLNDGKMTCNCGYVTTNREGPMTLTEKQRREAVGYLTVNCECWKGADRLLSNKETFSDEQLVKLVKNAKKSKDDGLVANAARRGVKIGEGVLTFNAEGRPTFNAKAEGSNADVGASDGTETEANDSKQQDTEDVDPSVEGGPDVGGTMGTGKVPGGTNNVRRRAPTLNAYLADPAVPDEVKEIIRNGREAIDDQKRQIVEALVANFAASDPDRALEVNALMALQLPVLKRKLKALPRGFPVPTFNAAALAAPVYGARPEAPVENADDADPDVLPIPTTNWAGDPAPERARA